MIELFFYWLIFVASDVQIVAVGALYVVAAGFLLIEMQSQETRRHWRRVYLDAKAYNDEYEGRVKRDGWMATTLDPPEPENYTITYRTPVPCLFCGRAPEHYTAAVDTTIRRFSTRGPEPKRRHVG